MNSQHIHKRGQNETITEFRSSDLPTDCRCLSDGEYLPSIRGLAKDLKISVITTMKAYEMLEEEGLVSATPGKGFQVNAQDSDMLREQHMRKVEDALLDALHAAEVAGLSLDEVEQMLKTLYLMNKEQ